MFSAAGLAARELQQTDVPALQAFCDANPEYFLLLSGQPPRPDEAQQIFDDRPPAHLRHGSRRLLGLQDGTGALQAVILLLSDFVQPAVWHLGLFMVATARQGQGDATALYTALEAWMRAQGARWARLSVLDVNVRAQRFWSRMGYVQVHRREDVPVGERRIGARVMLKPLAGGTLAQYLALVERDRPDSTLP